MNEHIAAPIIRLDESVAMADTEKDYLPSFHRVRPVHKPAGNPTLQKN
jgi:hypothetical protein